MRFDILGPLRVGTETGEIVITATRERVVLAMLVLHANRPVELGKLAEAVWGDQPPRNARNLLQGCVSRLRRQLTEDGVRDPVIATESQGYRLRVAPESVDLQVFRRLRDEARTAVEAGQPPVARDRFRAALAVWRGPALAGIDSSAVRNAAVVLDEECTQAREESVQVELDLGGAGDLVPELTELARQHPYRETMHGLLMLALYRAGRQAEALATYRRVRRLLHDDLGVEPSSKLHQLHTAILTRAPALAAPAKGSAAPVVPRELPADVVGFTGRGSALRALDALLADDPANPPTVVISAIAGTAGVGKTALAVHWAHRVAHRFPDGQLYLDLRGYASKAPVRPIEALAAFLRSVGVPPEQVPADEMSAERLYRSRLAGRRVLIVLDNVESAEQVRPLLPGSPGCVVVVTSRDRLAGLVAREGARRLTLDILTRDESRELLTRLLGADRAQAEPEAVDQLAELCAHLPLALRVAAELAGSLSFIPLAQLVSELGDQQRRLELLDVDGDANAAVKVVFSWSLQHLPPEVVSAFRLLGVHPGPDIDPYALSALANTSVEQARRALDALGRAYLVQPVGAGRYGMHDLLRAYAYHLAVIDDSNQARRAAVERLFYYYLFAAATAVGCLDPTEVHWQPQLEPPTTPTPDLTAPDVAREWLDTELPCLVAVSAYAAAHGWPTTAIRLSNILSSYLAGSRYHDGVAIHDYAEQAARRAGDLVGRGHALRNLGKIHGRLGRFGPGAVHHEQALELFRQAGDRHGEALALLSLGAIERGRGRYDPATDCYRRALALFRERGDRYGEARALTNLAVVEQRQGRLKSAAERYRQALAVFRERGDRYAEATALTNLAAIERQQGSYGQAIVHHEQALDLYRQLGHRAGEARTLNNLGLVKVGVGQYGPAALNHEQALDLFRQVGDRVGEASALNNLGLVKVRLGQYGPAASDHEQALTLFREIGDRYGQIWALNGLGEVAYATGRWDEALTHHTDAVAVAAATGARDQAARAHTGLGKAHSTLGNRTLARTHLECALAIYVELDVPDAADVRAQLAALAQPDSANDGAIA